MEEAIGAPSSLAVCYPKRLRASGRDRKTVMTEPPSPLTMLFSRHTKRREFITLLGGAAVAWPVAARAQQPERMRRMGVFMNLASDDPDAQARIGALLQGLQQYGWTIGGNLRVDYRWNVGDADRFRRYAADLVAPAPDVIVTVA